MGKKIGFFAIAVIIILVLFSFLVVSGANVKEVVVDGVHFYVPSEYDDKVVSDNLVKITSGNSSYFINGNLETNDINKVVNKYVNHKNKTENKSVIISHLNSKGMDIYKSVVSDNASVVHYWFLKGDQVYEIYTGTANSNSDNLILEMIS